MRRPDAPDSARGMECHFSSLIAHGRAVCRSPGNLHVRIVWMRICHPQYRSVKNQQILTKCEKRGSSMVLVQDASTWSSMPWHAYYLSRIVSVVLCGCVSTATISHPSDSSSSTSVTDASSSFSVMTASSIAPNTDQNTYLTYRDGGRCGSAGAFILLFFRFQRSVLAENEYDHPELYRTNALHFAYLSR